MQKWVQGIITWLLATIIAKMDKLQKGQDKLMASFDEVKASLAAAKASLAGVAQDVFELKAKIDALVIAGTGAITQAQLDEIGADASDLAASVKAVDDSTPNPVV